MISPDDDQRCKDRHDYPGHIVFVHVGTNRPRLCLSEAADQAFEQDPDALIWIFTERVFEPRIRERMQHGGEGRVRFVFTDEIPVLPLHEAFRQTRKFPPGGGDFWRVTSERFYYLHDLLCHLGLRVVVHLESDVMIYAPLTSLINTRRAKASMLYPLDKRRGIASVLFLEDEKACARLCQHGIDHPAPHDMDLLEQFYQANCGQAVASLPTVPEKLCVDLKLDKQRYARPKAEGWGIFDAAAIGQYLGGIDPVHDRRDTRGFVNEESPYNPASLNVCWEFIDGKKRPICLDDNGEVIRNLHIHSKQTHAFRSNAHGLPLDPDEIITGERVMTLCDVIVTSSAKLAYHKILTPGMPSFVNLNDYHLAGTTKIKQELFDILDDHRIIFVYGDLFRFFVNHVAPYLESDHVIVVHNSDENIDASYDVIFRNPRIRAVFAQNLLSLHPQMEGIPIGLANPMFPHGDIKAFYEACRHMQKRPAIFCEGISPTHPSRESLLDTLKQLGYVNGMQERKSFPEYIKQLVNCTHVLCPRGNGVDTHRLWETIYSLSIPTLTTSENHRALSTNCAITVEHWNQPLTGNFYSNDTRRFDSPKTFPNLSTFKSRFSHT